LGFLPTSTFATHKLRFEKVNEVASCFSNKERKKVSKKTRCQATQTRRATPTQEEADAPQENTVFYTTVAMVYNVEVIL
jgi:hypothetical protein